MSVPSRPILGIRQGRFPGPFPALHDAIKLFLVSKAAQDVPPGIRQAIVRVHVPEAADRPIVQVAEPEPATTRKEPPQMRHAALKIYPQSGINEGRSPLRFADSPPMRLRRDGGRKGGAGRPTRHPSGHCTRTRTGGRRSPHRTGSRTRAIPAAQWLGYPY